MSTKEIRALGHRLIDELNKGKAAAMAVIDELYATDIIYHCPAGKDISGLKDYKQNLSELFSAVPDAHFTIDDMVVEGDKLVMRYTMVGIYKVELRGKHNVGGISPTDKKITISTITIDRIADGKFVEEWERFDTLGFMQQLGLVPAPEEKKPEKI